MKVVRFGFIRRALVFQLAADPIDVREVRHFDSSLRSFSIDVDL